MIGGTFPCAGVQNGANTGVGLGADQPTKALFQLDEHFRYKHPCFIHIHITVECLLVIGYGVGCGKGQLDDSDTLAAITGSIAEAACGVPDWIKDKSLSYLDAPLREVYERWLG
ncbi:hypothetical protein Dhbcfc_01260 [Dehalobacter restrictus]|nr:hypothetical protein [Dehalobacter sp.]MDJ0304453.1 hypothetical protein [Dehalobacter sp.]